MNKKNKGSKFVKIGFILFVILFIMLFVLIKSNILNQISPKQFYYNNEKQLNMFIKNINKNSHKQNTSIKGVNDVYYYDHNVGNLNDPIEFVNFTLNYKPFSPPPYYIGLIYSYDGNAYYPDLDISNFHITSPNKWEYNDGDDYIKLERINSNWFMYEAYY